MRDARPTLHEPTPDEEGLRGGIVTCFAHAQRLGDDAHVPVDGDGEYRDFSLELDADAYSGALATGRRGS